MKTFSTILCAIVAIGTTTLCAEDKPVTPTPQPSVAVKPATAKIPETYLLEAAASIQRGVNTLLTRQNPDGSWCDDPAITAICTLALYQSHAKDNKARIRAAVDSGMKYFLRYQHADGSFSKGGRYANYTTAIVLTTLALVNRPEDTAAMLKARRFILGQQLDEDNKDYPTTPDNPNYGGIGYGPARPGTPAAMARPDLSNTHLALEALALTEHLEGETTPEGRKWKEKSDLSWGKALKFLRHCQSIPDTAGAQWVVSSDDPANDGGFVYKPETAKTDTAAQAGPGLRSYGSMTYAGLKSMIYAKVDKDDYRVKAARTWAENNYTLTENPGMGAEGLYYYYHTFAKANAVFGEATIKDKSGKAHNWREDLVRAILNREQNGQWKNDAGRWMESIPELVTAYTLLAAEIALADQLKD